MTIDRRDFLQAIAGGVLISSNAASGAGAEVPPAETTGWYDRPMRWAQLALIENNPGNCGREFWLDYFRRIHADAGCLSAGGCVAFYPTKIPLHYRSKWLGNRDTFGDLLKGCRELGMMKVRCERLFPSRARRCVPAFPTAAESRMSTCWLGRRLSLTATNETLLNWRSHRLGCMK